MDYATIYCPASTDALKTASHVLRSKGLRVLQQPDRSEGFILLDVPSLASDGKLRSGEAPELVLNNANKNAILLGGGLDSPLFASWRRIDFLKDECYLQKNAALTAVCALQIILNELPATPNNVPMLVIGWGRIGKELSALLRKLNVRVSVASTKPENRDRIEALGMEAVDSAIITSEKYRVIINTAPAPIRLSESVSSENAPIKIDLASFQGLPGDDVIRARGLPGKYIPESAGVLIAQTAMEHIKEYLK